MNYLKSILITLVAFVTSVAAYAEPEAITTNLPNGDFIYGRRHPRHRWQETGL